MLYRKGICFIVKIYLKKYKNSIINAIIDNFVNI